MLEQYNKVWLSRDMGNRGNIDLWSSRPEYNCDSGMFWIEGCRLAFQYQHYGWGGKHNGDLLDHLTNQLGTPKPGELWEIELYD